MISKEQYLEYKKLVEEYEQAEYEAGMREAEEDDFDDDFDADDLEEQRENERAETAMNCTCGAWVFSKNGTVCHVADCICGAE